MKKLFTFIVMMVLMLSISVSSFAQQMKLSGRVLNAENQASVIQASVKVKNQANVGTSTDNDGKFQLSVSKLPVTLVVTSVGFTTKEVEVAVVQQNGIQILLQEEAVTLGDEVVVSASRTPEKFIQSPVTIERISAAQIKEQAAPSFYDALANLKGVEFSTQSLTFKSVNTRGFNSNGNVRFNQFVDGMDNQAPGLNFSVGNVIGLSDLDVKSVELLPGASSALYGPGGTNGTLLMSSLSPFEKEGVSFMMKGGFNHVNDGATGVQPYKQADLRLAKQWNQKFGFKAVVSYMEAEDWHANDYRNFDRTTRQLKDGTRSSDPNYDGINVYGDEITQNMRAISNAVSGRIEQGLLQASGGAFNVRNVLNATFPNAVPTPAQYGQFIASLPAPLRANAAIFQSYYPFYVGNRAGLVPDQYVSRTGYNEADLVDYGAKSFKVSGALHYKIAPTVEAILQMNYGSGTSVYTGTDRYSLRNFSIGQYKAEIKGNDFFLRAYTTQEDAGDSYNATILGTFINEGSKASTDWYPQFVGTYIGAKLQGAPDAQAYAAARGAADQGRFDPNSPAFYLAKQSITSRPIGPQNGAKFSDKTNLYHYEGMYNFSSLLKNAVDLQVGAHYRLYDLNSGGTIFDDANREINIKEQGAFIQIGKKLFNEKLKLNASTRYDKNQNFDGRFTPRASMVYTFAKDQNFRLSYQMGFRNPTTQNQYIDLAVGGGSIRLIGGLPEFFTKYNLYANKPYTSASYQAFQRSAFQGQANPALLKEYSFDAKGLRPETVSSYEAGYKGVLGGKLLVDAYGYYSVFKDFITGIEVYQKNPTASDPSGLSAPIKYNMPVNASGDVSTYGAGLGLDYKIKDFMLNGNASYNQIANLPADYINDFNTPKMRYVLGIGHANIIKNVGFNINYRYQDKFIWNSTFASGEVPAFQTFDAQINFKVPSVNTMFKFGGSNILNKYYTNALGNPAIGAMYYFSIIYN